MHRLASDIVRETLSQYDTTWLGLGYAHLSCFVQSNHPMHRQIIVLIGSNWNVQAVLLGLIVVAWFLCLSRSTNVGNPCFGNPVSWPPKARTEAVGCPSLICWHSYRNISTKMFKNGCKDRWSIMTIFGPPQKSICDLLHQMTISQIIRLIICHKIQIYCLIWDTWH